MKIVERIKGYTLSQYILRLLAGFMIPVLLSTMVGGGAIYEKSFYDHLYFPGFVIAVAVFFGVFFFVKKDKIVYYVLLGTTMIYCCLNSIAETDYMLFFGFCAVVFMLVYFFEFPLSGKTIPSKLKWIVCGAFIAFFTLFVGGLCCAYHRNYDTPCFDFGLFAQMFYYMKETGKCLVTCERDGLLSHFAVHFSPVFYLILPLYWVFPSPYTLLIIQPLIVSSAVIPLVLLCKHFKLSDGAAVVFAGCLVLYPAFLGGSFYYIHENCFLTPFILWLVYFFEKERYIPAAVFAVLTLSVKEDAAIYVAVVALYFIFSKKSWKWGGGILVFSVVYFLVVIKLMSSYGNGVMTESRFGDYIYDDGGVFSLVKAVLQNPANVIYNIFKEEKLYYILQITVGLSFLPFAVKKPAKLFLFIPLIVINLMPNYAYQYNISVQYTFGSGALLFYLAVSNYAEMGKNRNKLLFSAFLSSLILFSGGFLFKIRSVVYNEEEKHYLEVIDEAFALIPENASVSASAFFVSNLSQRDIIYEIERTKHFTEYVAADLRYEREFDMDYYLDNGYEIIYLEEGVAAILHNPDYQ